MADIAQIKLLIVDDDSDFSDILKIYLNKFGIKNIFVAHDFASGKSLLDKEIPDLVLLDIDLKGEQNGIDLGIYVRQKYPKSHIIFFTNNFTEDVFESCKQVQPNAFLDKQLNELKVRQAVELALIQESLVNLPNNAPPPQYCYFASEFVFVKVGNIFKKIEMKDIDYIYYADRYTNFQVGNKSYSVNLPIKDLSKSLTDYFMQIHQSYIVNLKKIGQVNILNYQVEVCGKWIPIGVSFRKTFREKLLFLT